MNHSTIYILLGIISFLCSVASVLGTYIYCDAFGVKQRVMNNPRTPIIGCAVFFVVYYLMLLSLGI